MNATITMYEKLDELTEALVEQSNKIQETLELIDKYLISMEKLFKENKND